MKSFLFALGFFASIQTAFAADVVRPKYPLSCTAAVIAKEMKVTLKDDIPLPTVKYASEVLLVDFQNAVEPQWGFRPDVILNVYVAAANDIYVLDGAADYAGTDRTIDDVLAHELVHFVQVQYKGTLVPDDFSEYEAVLLQQWYRQKFMEQGEDPCAS
jgi:hypothetical protein